MNPTFHQQTQNKLDINSPYKNISIPISITSSIKRISFIKKGEGLNKVHDMAQSNNFPNGQEIIKGTKTIINFSDNISNLQNQKNEIIGKLDKDITFSNNNNEFINSDHTIEINDNIQIINLNKNKNLNNKKKNVSVDSIKKYKELIKKIATQLRVKVRIPTKGFFHFAFLKGEYPLIIIKKIYNDMINHKIEFNDDFFKLYTEKYYKYRKLIKRIAFLFKLRKKKSGQILKNANHEQKNLIQIIHNNHNNSIEKSRNLNISNSMNIKDEINSKKILNKYYINNTKVDQLNNNNEQRIMINNCISDMSNQNKAKTQVNRIKSSQYYYNFYINIYNINNFSDKKINPINPFIISKEKTLYNSKNSKSKSNYNISNNLPSIKFKANNNIDNNKEEAKYKNNNIKVSSTPIFSEIPIDSKFAELSNDNEIEDDFPNIKIVNNTIKSKKNEISSSLSNNFVIMSKEHNLNLSKRKSNNLNIMNDFESNNKINESNISIVNNYNTDSNNNITFSSVNNEEFQINNISMDSNKNKAKKIQFKIFPFKKLNESSLEEEKISNSNIESQKINLSSIQKINCNTFNGHNSSENRIGNDLILYQKEISTSVDENSFIKKFSLFLSHNNILIQNNLPLAVSERGQKYLKKNEFWEKYINFIYLNYEMNNEQLSLFCFIHIIEQYFLWCENLNEKIISDFKKLIIDIIGKIYDYEKIKKFCFMNKIQNLEELFGKYKDLKIINNNNDTYNQVEIKISNEVQCNCDLCKNEYGCMKKSSELNKSSIAGLNIDTLFYKSNKQMDIINPPKNEHILFDQNSNSIFNKNKTLHTFVTEYEYISDINYGNKKSSISHKLETNELFNIDKDIDLSNDNYGNKGKSKNEKIEKKKRNKSYNQEEKKGLQNESEEEAKSKKKKKSKKSSKKKKDKKYKGN